MEFHGVREILIPTGFQPHRQQTSAIG